MTKKVPNRAPVRRKRTGRRVALILAALVALGVGAMHLNARTVHVRYATVRLDDLPAAFEGKTILYASDIDLGGINTPRRAADASAACRRCSRTYCCWAATTPPPPSWTC